VHASPAGGRPLGQRSRWSRSRLLAPAERRDTAPAGQNGASHAHRRGQSACLPRFHARAWSPPPRDAVRGDACRVVTQGACRGPRRTCRLTGGDSCFRRLSTPRARDRGAASTRARARRRARRDDGETRSGPVTSSDRAVRHPWTPAEEHQPSRSQVSTPHWRRRERACPGRAARASRGAPHAPNGRADDRIAAQRGRAGVQAGQTCRSCASGCASCAGKRRACTCCAPR
jgi:hypothetical protein